MHDAIVTMKDGTTLTGPLWTWRPQYGWFTLVDGPPIALDDVAALTVEGGRTVNGDVVQRDGLEQAKSEGWKPGESPDGNLILLTGRTLSRVGLGDCIIYRVEPLGAADPGFLAREDWDKPWEPGEMCFYRGPLDSGFYSCRFHRESERGLHLWIDHRVEAKPEEQGAFGMR
ncbi:MAG: hypothetical protein MUF54_08250 [Polyangiaceae bacterium]|jgi:hypothetical protein|nr:hypothetical protein [Polyangiaceae bacterium]